MPSWAELAREKSPKPAPTSIPKANNARQDKLNLNRFSTYTDDDAAFEQDLRRALLASTITAAAEVSAMPNDNDNVNCPVSKKPISPPPARGEGLSRAPVGRISVDCWSVILSFCSFSTVIATSHTCVSLRRLGMKPSLWTDISEAFTAHFMISIGHDVPTLEFSLPIEMSAVIQRRRGGTIANTTGFNRNATNTSLVGRNNHYDEHKDEFYEEDEEDYYEEDYDCGDDTIGFGGGGGVIVTDNNEAAAHFIRLSRFLTRNEHRLWHLKEIKKTVPVIVNKALKVSYVTAYDETSPRPAMGVPITVMSVERKNSPFLKPSDISTIFSHQAANAMGACRLSTSDVTSSFSDFFLAKLGCAFGTPSLHKELSRILVSAALIEISLSEAVKCIEGYELPSNSDTYNGRTNIDGADANGRRAATGRGSFQPSRGANNTNCSSHSYTYTMEMLFSDITIDASETRYFAIRQLSTEATIGVVFVDPLLTLVVAAGSSRV